MPPRRWGFLALFILLVAGAWAQEQKPPETQEPPEEDQSLVPKEYSFNPLQARKELDIGNYYFKTGRYPAAAGRFREATKWDQKFAEAYLRMGETYDKMKDPAAARKAYEKYLELEPDGKQAAQIRKRLSAKP